MPNRLSVWTLRLYMRLCVPLMAFLFAASVAAHAEPPAKPFSPEALAFYEKQVLPI